MRYSLCLWLRVCPDGRDATGTCPGVGVRIRCAEGVHGAVPPSEWLMRLHFGALPWALAPLTSVGVGWDCGIRASPCRGWDGLSLALHPLVCLLHHFLGGQSVLLRVSIMFFHFFMLRVSRIFALLFLLGLCLCVLLYLL